MSLRRFRVSRLLAAGTLLLAVELASAHHGVSSKFDAERTQQLQGRVSHVDWANPHVHLFLIVERDGVEQPWYVELESPQLLELNGWHEDTLQAGAIVTVEGYPARDGSPQLWGNEVRRDDTRLFDTSRYPTLLSSIVEQPQEATPRGPDGKPRFSAAPGRAGYWVPTVTTLQEDGADVAMAANGQLVDPADAARVAPLQPWALALYQQRQASFLRSDPTFIECRPPAGPRKFLDPFGIQLLEDWPLQRIFVIAGGGNHDWHLIYTDGRALDGDAWQLDAGNLLYYGRNSAHWEGETLVIESAGYNEKFWLPGGLPHSEQMQVTERLTRPDYHTLQYQLTIDDPGAYTRAWQASWTLQWLEGQDPPEHYCQDNRL